MEKRPKWRAKRHSYAPGVDWQRAWRGGGAGCRISLKGPDSFRQETTGSCLRWSSVDVQGATCGNASMSAYASLPCRLGRLAQRAAAGPKSARQRSQILRMAEVGSKRIQNRANFQSSGSSDATPAALCCRVDVQRHLSQRVHLSHASVSRKVILKLSDMATCAAGADGRDKGLVRPTKGYTHITW